MQGVLEALLFNTRGQSFLKQKSNYDSNDSNGFFAKVLHFYRLFLTSFVSYNKVQFSLEIFAVALGFLLQKAFDDGRQHKPGSSSCAYNTQ